MKLIIQNLRHKHKVILLRKTLEELQIAYEPDIVLGELTLAEPLTSDTFLRFNAALKVNDMCILQNRRDVLTEQVKNAVTDMLDGDLPVTENYSSYISRRLGLNYTYLANIFSASEDITIEQYIIVQKIERAKELLLYYNYNIGQVAKMLNYSSIGHLSNQFKKVTGSNPSTFKKNTRRNLTDLQ